MIRWRVLLGLVVVAFLAGGLLSGDEPKKDAPVKVRGSLPPNWGKLGLNDQQRQEIYQIQSDYGTQIAALRQQISDLQAKERKDMEKVLTDAQKQRLREIVAGKAPADSKDEKPEKKP
jgi:hypothetical protein